MNKIKLLGIMVAVLAATFVVKALDITKLSAPEAAEYGYNYVITVSVTDVTNSANATSTNGGTAVNIFPGGTSTFPTGTVVQAVSMRLITPFIGPIATTTNSMTVCVGEDVAAGTNRFLPNTQVSSNTTIWFATSTSNKVFTAASNVYALFVANQDTTNKASTFTNGQVKFYLKTHQLGRLGGQP